MALLQVDKKLTNQQQNLIGMGENVSGNTGGPDWRDACCGGGQLHLWGAWQEGQVWDHTHQVCPITRYLHDWGCQVLCFFFQLTKANVKIKCWCWNIWTSEINFDLFQPSHAWEDARHLQGQSWGNSCCFDKCCNEVEFFSYHKIIFLDFILIMFTTRALTTWSQLSQRWEVWHSCQTA